jgi:hypothetical protein
MMRKLAVTVFAMSLTLVGCGSSSTSKKDAAGDAAGDTIVQKDTSPKDTTVTSETGTPEDAKVADAAADTVVPPGDALQADVAVDVAPLTDARDTLAADRQPDSTPPRLDVAADIKTDAPADTAPAGDASLEAGGDAQAD